MLLMARRIRWLHTALFHHLTKYNINRSEPGYAVPDPFSYYLLQLPLAHVSTRPLGVQLLTLQELLRGTLHALTFAGCNCDVTRL